MRPRIVGVTAGTATAMPAVGGVSGSHRSGEITSQNLARMVRSD